MFRSFLALMVTTLTTGLVTGPCPGNDEATPTLEDRLSSAGQMVLPRPDGPPLTLTWGSSRHQVFCFVGCECPLARLYGQKLNLLADQYAEQGFDFIGVNSNQQDTLQEVGEYQEQLGIQFPIVKDYDNRLADLLSAQRTPEIVIVSPDRKIVYRGRVDNQYSPGIARAAATEHDLAAALRQISQGEPVSQPKTVVEGCLIGRIRKPAEGSSVTYANQVARILERHCIECHRE
ncbi:MAG: redoxin family protein, partial [Planctomycetota bacterium]|nr:redoxin family protein [Planctomycetota bacterium]